MGSQSDWSTMSKAVETLESFGLSPHTQVLSAHRMPNELYAFAETAAENGYRVIIAGAGGAAHLPGMLAAKTILPVLGVPVPTAHLNGHDSLYSIVQMPAGVPVATFAIGEAGAVNAALFAIEILAIDDAALQKKLAEFRRARHDAAASSVLPPA
jgi:5-(carboxyamino)imidazole ribonucleotide mutase